MPAAPFRSWCPRSCAAAGRGRRRARASTPCLTAPSPAPCPASSRTRSAPDRRPWSRIRAPVGAIERARDARQSSARSAWCSTCGRSARNSTARTYRVVVIGTGRTKLRKTSRAPGRSTYGSVSVSTRSGVPSCQPLEDTGGVGASAGLPSGAPLPAHVAIECDLVVAEPPFAGEAAVSGLGQPRRHRAALHRRHDLARVPAHRVVVEHAERRTRHADRIIVGDRRDRRGRPAARRHRSGDDSSRSWSKRMGAMSRLNVTARAAGFAGPPFRRPRACSGDGDEPHDRECGLQPRLELRFGTRHGPACDSRHKRTGAALERTAPAPTISDQVFLPT